MGRAFSHIGLDHEILETHCIQPNPLNMCPYNEFSLNWTHKLFLLDSCVEAHSFVVERISGYFIEEHDWAEVN